MKKYLFVTFISILVLSQTAFADFNIKDWEFERNIQTRWSGLFEVNFDEHIFENSASGLRDLRIISGNSVETPYKLAVEKSTIERSRISGRVFDNSVTQDGNNEFVIDLGSAGLFHNQIDILSNSTNFRREVRVEASNDQSDWSVIQKSAIIYDVTDIQAALKARNTTVKYPESTKRYLRVTLLNKGDIALNISGALAYYEKTVAAQNTNYTATIAERLNDAEKRAALLIIDLGSAGLPNNSMRLSVSDSNFQRDVALEGSNDKDKWYIVTTRDIIFSFQTPKFTGSKLDIVYPENNYRYLRLTVFNQDNTPLNVAGASVSGVLRKLVFEAQQGETYKLYYGNPEVRYPQYDIEKYFKYLETEDLPTAQLGAHTRNPLYERKTPPKPPISERSPWLLPLVLSISVVILGAFLFKLFLSVKKKLPPPR